MNIKKGNIWDSTADIIAIPTNSVLNNRGDLIMGAGLAKQAAQRHPQLPRLAGQSIKKAFDPHFYRWVVIEVGDRKIGLIQTKTDWRKPSTMDLIMGALWSLSYWMNYRDTVSTVAMPMIGCGLGGLPKKEVLEAIKNNLWQVEERVELWDP